MDRIDRGAGAVLLEVEASGCGCSTMEADSTVEAGRSGDADIMMEFWEPNDGCVPRSYR